jgi:hypothetical protein
MLPRYTDFKMEAAKQVFVNGHSEKHFSPFVYRLIDELPLFGLKAKVVPVLFEFQSGAGYMMKVSKAT